ncbi:MAG: helix-turn-helix transcriptional regulator [Oscillospiraceae bacterium]|nr:helix-turn-helix transcriptional regulator [Oscillospiraceae bacterium]
MARIIDGEQMNIVGDIIREYRTKRKMSQQLLSDRLELLGVYVCRGSVSRIEDKSRTVTDIELYAIAKVLDIPWQELSPEKQFNL